MFNNLVHGGPIPPNFRRDVTRAAYVFIAAVAVFLGVWGLVVVIRSDEDTDVVKFRPGTMTRNDTSAGNSNGTAEWEDSGGGNNNNGTELQ